MDQVFIFVQAIKILQNTLFRDSLFCNLQPFQCLLVLFVKPGILEWT